MYFNSTLRATDNNIAAMGISEEKN